MATVDMMMTIKLLIDTKANKVVYAEASKEFVDFLFFLLALPIATVTRLLTSEAMVGSIANLYTSFANLNESYLQQDIEKDVLLNPMIFSSVISLPLSINRSSIKPSRDFYTCRCDKAGHVTNICNGAYCSTCCHWMTHVMKFVPATEMGKTVDALTGFIDSEGYVKEMVPYMVSDDLSVMPISTMSIHSTMDTFKASKLEERKVDIGAKEALELLKISFQSTTVLTDVFLGRKEITSKAVKIEDSSTLFAIEMEEKLNQTLLTREHMSKEELQDARKELINVFQTLSVGTSDVRLKRIGDIQRVAFMSYELVGHWQNNIRDPNWHPFKMILKEGKHQQVVDEEDSKLKELRTDWGREVYNAVVKALMEINEYNPTELTPVHELWHFKEGRKATLKEGIQCLSDKLKCLNDQLQKPSSKRGRTK